MEPNVDPYIPIISNNNNNKKHMEHRRGLQINLLFNWQAQHNEEEDRVADSAMSGKDIFSNAS